MMSPAPPPREQQGLWGPGGWARSSCLQPPRCRKRPGCCQPAAQRALGSLLQMWAAMRTLQTRQRLQAVRRPSHDVAPAAVHGLVGPGRRADLPGLRTELHVPAPGAQAAYNDTAQWVRGPLNLIHFDQTEIVEFDKFRCVWERGAPGHVRLCTPHAAACGRLHACIPGPDHGHKRA